MGVDAGIRRLHGPVQRGRAGEVCEGEVADVNMYEIMKLLGEFDVEALPNPDYLIKMEMKRPVGTNVVAYFKSVQEVKTFTDFLEELIGNVKKKALEEAKAR